MIGETTIDTRRTIDMPGLGDPSLALTPTRRGLFLCNRHDIVGVSLVSYGEWAEPEAKLVTALLQAGDIVVECGAHVGTMTVPMARAVGPRGIVHAVELQPYFARLLNANLALNGISNAVVRLLAAGAENGSLRVPIATYQHPANYAGLTFVGRPTDGSGTGQPVPVRPLDSVFRDLPRLKLLKLDIENMEPAVLAGAAGLIRRLRPIVHLDCRVPACFAAARAQLGALGYRLYWHAVRGYNPHNYRGNNVNRFGAQGEASLLAMPPAVAGTPAGLPPAEDFSDIERLWPGLLGPTEPVAL